MFGRKKKQEQLSYDKEKQKTVIRCSICTGEQVAGFKDLHTGKFSEMMSDILDTLEFGKARAEDGKEILALYRSVMGTPGCVWTEEYPGRDTIEFDLKRDALYVMRTPDGRIIGSISIDDDEAVASLECWNKELAPAAEISRLAVAASHMNCGIARTMLAKLIEEVKSLGYAAVHYMVAKGNERALRSYAKLNLQQVGETHIFGEDYICFEKAL